MSNSRWVHAQCTTCWNERNLSRQADPKRYTRGPEDTCCWCSKPTRSGIYVRYDPETVPCKGVHPEEIAE